VRKTAAGAIACVILLAGCGSSAPAQPSARSLALKVPGCSHPQAAAPSVYAREEVTCTTPYASVDVATFSTQGDEQSWLVSLGRQGGSECIQGSRWAAGVMADRIPTNPASVKVARALGGRLVSAGWC
jgi:hypothetical protein